MHGVGLVDSRLRKTFLIHVKYRAFHLIVKEEDSLAEFAWSGEDNERTKNDRELVFDVVVGHEKCFMRAEGCSVLQNCCICL